MYTFSTSQLRIKLAIFASASYPSGFDPKVDYSEDLGDEKVGHEPRLKSCWTMLIIGPLSTM